VDRIVSSVGYGWVAALLGVLTSCTSPVELDRATRAAINLSVRTVSGLPVAEAEVRVAMVVPDARGEEIGGCQGTKTGESVGTTDSAGRILFDFVSVRQSIVCANLTITPPSGAWLMHAEVTIGELGFRHRSAGVDTVRLNVVLQRDTL
jgi:hypothetical protein